MIAAPSAPGLHITEHFTLDEFAQPQRYGCPALAYPWQWVSERLLPLCQMLERVRQACAGRPVLVCSGYRSLVYNTRMGGAVDSQHCQGRAADVLVDGLLVSDVRHVVEQLLMDGSLPLLKGVGIYPTFMHLDIRPGSALVHWYGTRRVT